MYIFKIIFLVALFSANLFLALATKNLLKKKLSKDAKVGFSFMETVYILNILLIVTEVLTCR